MVKKIVITGASGFIGKHLIARLERSTRNEIYSLPHQLMENPIALEERLKIIKPHFIYHLAAAGNISGMHDDPDMLISNVSYLFNLLQVLKEIPIEGFINVSSSSVLLPYQTTYAATKLGAEALCKAYVDQYDLPIVTMRPCSLYGPGDYKGHLIPIIFKSCLEHEQMELSESPVHDWTYVGDFVEQMVNYATEAKNHSGQVIHVGTGNSTSNYWLLKEIEEITDKRANIVGTFAPYDYDTQEWIASSALGDVEFTKTQLHEGLQKVYKSFTLQ